MINSKQVPIMLSIPKTYRDTLRKMAAEKNLENPNQVTSASALARKFLCEKLDKLMLEETGS